jgi:hypothetical protein
VEGGGGVRKFRGPGGRSKYDPGTVPLFRGCGVYRIICKKTGYIYIGASKTVRHRLLTHIKHLERGEHSCVALQYAWSLLGEKNFIFEVAEECGPNVLYDKEVEHREKCGSPQFSSIRQKFNNRPRHGSVAGRFPNIWTDPVEREKLLRQRGVGLNSKFRKAGYVRPH